jgi:flagellar protein FlaJ
MNFSLYLPKLKEKVGFKKKTTDDSGSTDETVAFNADLLDVDLFCHIIYMSALADSHLPHDKLFERASSLPFVSSRYFKKVQFLSRKLAYDYPEACRMTAKSIKEPVPKSFLFRMSNALAAGEDEAEFLAREAAIIGETYSNDYEHKIESLKKWTDAYVALILSASMVVVICTVSMLIFPIDPKLIVTMLGVMLLSTLLGAWIIYRASPKEIKTIASDDTSNAQKIAKVLFKLLVPPCVVITFIFLLANFHLGWVLVLSSLFLLPVGLVVSMDDRRIDKQDQDIAIFLRSLGSTSKAIGSTITEGLTRLDFNALRSLKNQVHNLNKSLQVGVSPALAWQKFVQETGSDHVKRSVQIFMDGINVGADPERVGNQSSTFAMKVNILRSKRKMVSSAFSYLCFAMHATIAVLLLAIYQIMINFAALTASIEGVEPEDIQSLTALPSFQFFMSGSSGQLEMLHTLTMVLLFTLTFVNAIAIKTVDGGHNYKFFMCLSITLLITGLCLIFVPGVISTLFSGIA